MFTECEHPANGYAAEEPGQEAGAGNHQQSPISTTGSTTWHSALTLLSKTCSVRSLEMQEQGSEFECSAAAYTTEDSGQKTVAKHRL